MSFRPSVSEWRNLNRRLCSLRPKQINLNHSVAAGHLITRGSPRSSLITLLQSNLKLSKPPRQKPSPYGITTLFLPCAGIRPIKIFKNFCLFFAPHFTNGAIWYIIALSLPYKRHLNGAHFGEKCAQKKQNRAFTAF